MTARIAWQMDPGGMACTGSAVGDVRAEIWLPSWPGRRSHDYTIKLMRPGHAAEYSGAPTIPAAKERAEKMLAEAEGTSK